MLKFLILASSHLPMLHVLNISYAIFHEICPPVLFEPTMKYDNLLIVGSDPYKWAFHRQSCDSFASAPSSLDRWT